MRSGRRHFLRYAIRISPRAETQLRELPASAARRLAVHLGKMARHAPAQPSEGCTHIRVEQFRALCEVDHDLGAVVVLDISPSEAR